MVVSSFIYRIVFPTLLLSWILQIINFMSFLIYIFARWIYLWRSISVLRLRMSEIFCLQLLLVWLILLGTYLWVPILLLLVHIFLVMPTGISLLSPIILVFRSYLHFGTVVWLYNFMLIRILLFGTISISFI